MAKMIGNQKKDRQLKHCDRISSRTGTDRDLGRYRPELPLDQIAQIPPLSSLEAMLAATPLPSAIDPLLPVLRRHLRANNAEQLFCKARLMFAGIACCRDNVLF